jgi:hypothetical protein
MPPPKAALNPGTAQRPTLQQQLDQMKSQTTKDREREQKARRALTLLLSFQNEVLARAEGWQIAARNIGSAYATAAKRHADALADQDKIDALKTQVLFSVLTVATSGALSWVSSGLAMAECFPERKALIEIQ